MTRPSRLLAGLCLSLSLIPAHAARWPGFRGERGDGQARAGLPEGDGPLSLAIRWQRPLGSGYAGIAVDGDLVVTAGRADADDVVVALAAEDGTERWRHSLGPAYSGHDGSHDGPIATPAIAEGRVFALGAHGRLVALAAGDGSLLWSRELATDLSLAAPYYGYASSPRVIGDRVVLWVGSEPGHVAAFAVATGELVWRQLEESTDAQSPIVATLAGKEQVLVIGGTHLAGLDPLDGSVLWKLEHQGGPTAMGAPTSSPIPLDDERIFFKHGADSTLVVRVAKTAGGLEAKVEREIRGLARSYSPPALAGNHLFGYSGRFLSAIDPASGEVLWRSREPGDGFLVAVEDQLVVLTKEGELHLGPASPSGWTSSTRLGLFEELAWTPPAIVGGSVYARSLGSIARVDLVRATATAASPVVEDAVPAVLAPLVAELATATDKDAAVTRFLAGRTVPIVSGDEVVFLWRGRGSDLAIAGDMIGMRREEPMHRLGDTDLWWWQTRLDRRARVSYVFLVDNEPAVDPAHGRVVAGTVLGPDLNWQRGRGLNLSWLAMPDWPGSTPPPGASRGRIERFEVAVAKPDSTTGETVPVQLTAWLPPGYDQGTDRLPVVYVHHRSAFEHGDWPATLDRAVGRTVAPLIAVQVEAPRGVELVALFANTVVPAVDQRFRTSPERDGRFNVGMGFTSHAALRLTLGHPDLFGGMGLQSYYALEEMMAETDAALASLTEATPRLRVYLEWGAWDLRSPHEGMNMVESSRWLADRLRGRGLQAVGGEVADTTDFASWRNRTELLLQTLVPGPAPDRDALAAWVQAPAAP